MCKNVDFIIQTIKEQIAIAITLSQPVIDEPFDKAQAKARGEGSVPRSKSPRPQRDPDDNGSQEVFCSINTQNSSGMVGSMKFTQRWSRKRRIL
jgi:hypothetical protein